MTTAAVIAAAPEDVVGTTAPDLIAPLWVHTEIDVYISRTMELRSIACGRGWGDTVWIHEPPAPGVCYYRVTPARMAGLVLRLRTRQEALLRIRGADVVLAGADATKAEELSRIVDRDLTVLKLLKAEFKARWPNAVEVLKAAIPEDIEEAPRPSDAWLERVEPATQTVARAAPLTEDDTALLEWARTMAPPVEPFRPNAYAVAINGRAWLDRLLARARGDAPAGRPDALHRLRALKTTPPPPASEGATRVAAVLAGREQNTRNQLTN